MTLPSPQHQMLVRFLQPEKILPPLPGLNSGAVASLMGLSEADYEAVLTHFDDSAESAATLLLEDPGAKAAVSRLGQMPVTIVGLGDSLTGDRLGWFEILRAAGRHLGAEAWNLVNAGVAGQTTAEILARVPAVVAARPDAIVYFAGTNDVRRFGDVPRPQLPLTATVSAMRAAYELASSQGDAKWLWVTPVGIDPEKVKHSPLFQMSQVSFAQSDLAALAEAMTSFAEPVVDLYGKLADPGSALPESYDGVHLEPPAHVVVARSVLSALEKIFP